MIKVIIGLIIEPVPTLNQELKCCLFLHYPCKHSLRYKLLAPFTDRTTKVKEVNQ